MKEAGRKVLVVEDNDFVRIQLARFLASEGYSVIESENGEQALSHVTDDIALALVDVRMEPMDGFELVRTLRASNVQIPIAFVTGDDNPDLLSRASRLGVQALLRKPLQKSRLLNSVARILRLKQSPNEEVTAQEHEA